MRGFIALRKGLGPGLRRDDKSGSFRSLFREGMGDGAKSKESLHPRSRPHPLPTSPLKGEEPTRRVMIKGPASPSRDKHHNRVSSRDGRTETRSPFPPPSWRSTRATAGPSPPGRSSSNATISAKTSRFRPATSATRCSSRTTCPEAEVLRRCRASLAGEAVVDANRQRCRSRLGHRARRRTVELARRQAAEPHRALSIAAAIHGRCGSLARDAQRPRSARNTSGWYDPCHDSFPGTPIVRRTT